MYFLSEIFLKVDILGHDEPTVLQKLFQNCCCLRTIEILRDVNEEFVLQIFMTKTLTCRRRDNYCEISLIS